MAKNENKSITVNDVEYSLDDFTAEQSVLLNHVNDLDRKLANAQFNLDQLMVGRDAFVERLDTALKANENVKSDTAA